MITVSVLACDVTLGYSAAMESLQEILAHYGPPEDPEVLAVKQYVSEHFKTPVSVAVHGTVLVVTVPSAALANTLRLHGVKIQEACNLQKRLIFRIG